MQEHGFTLQWLRRQPAIYAVLVERGGEATRLEWAADSDFRFFPTIPDEIFGYILHPVDVATNKVSAAYGRREPRDVVDLLTIINEIRRMARYTDAISVLPAIGQSIPLPP